MEPLYDYIHQGGCYRYGVGWCRIQIYPGKSTGDAPVVLCSELPEDRGDEMVERLAAPCCGSSTVPPAGDAARDATRS
jgi:hypothetical protein